MVRLRSDVECLLEHPPSDEPPDRQKGILVGVPIDNLKLEETVGRVESIDQKADASACGSQCGQNVNSKLIRMRKAVLSWT